MVGMDTSLVMAFTICTLGKPVEASTKYDAVSYTVNNVSFSDQIEDSAHEILLSSSVTPIVTFKSIKNVFLGKPFSPNCIPSFATNNYTVYEKPRSKVKHYYCEDIFFIDSQIRLGRRKCHCE